MIKKLLSAAALTTCAALASAQSGSYPAKTVRIIVPVAAGGNVDLIARALAQQISESVGEPVLVENRPGASSLVGTQYVAKTAPDGYTLLAVANTFAVAPSIVSSPGYDPFRDFAAVSLTCLVPQLLVANPALPARSVKDLVALAKARPGEITYATSGAGSTGHMAAELFSRQVGIRMLHVPYKGNAQAIVDVIGGQVMIMFDQISTSEPHVKAGKLRALAVTSRTRSPLFPEVATVDEAGVPGFEDITFNGLMAPAGTAREVRLRMQQEVAKAAVRVRDRFIERGVEIKASASPEEFASLVKTEFDKKAKLARDAHIRID